MKRIFTTLTAIITIVALLVFASGIVLTIIGAYEIGVAFTHLWSDDAHTIPGYIATGLLKAVDMFLIAIVFYVFAVGLLILFSSPDAPLPIKLPEWLRVKNFMQLKVILWEAILTTLVVSYLTGQAERRFQGGETDYKSLTIPGVIFLIALSLYFLKKGENK